MRVLSCIHLLQHSLFHSNIPLNGGFMVTLCDGVQCRGFMVTLYEGLNIEVALHHGVWCRGCMVTLPECVITRGMLWRSKVNAQAWSCGVHYPCMNSMRWNVILSYKLWEMAKGIFCTLVWGSGHPQTTCSYVHLSPTRTHSLKLHSFAPSPSHSSSLTPTNTVWMFSRVKEGGRPYRCPLHIKEFKKSWQCRIWVSRASCTHSHTHTQHTQVHT